MPPGPRPNLFMDAVPGTPTGGDPVLGRSRGSGVHLASQFWTLRRVGGTIQQPWYQVTNRGTGQCLYWGGVTGAEGPGPHRIGVSGCAPRDFNLQWWQFRTSRTSRSIRAYRASPTNCGFTGTGKATRTRDCCASSCPTPASEWEPPSPSAHAARPPISSGGSIAQPSPARDVFRSGLANPRRIVEAPAAGRGSKGTTNVTFDSRTAPPSHAIRRRG